MHGCSNQEIANFVQENASTLGIDWSEVILLLIGAVIGFVGSAAILFMERLLDRKGKLNIFYRFTHDRPTQSGWGFDESADGCLYFTAPVVYELQNTSNTTRVIRDVSLLLYDGDTYVAKMDQLDHLRTTKRRGKEIIEEKDFNYGAEKGTYSFVLEPRSIQRQECEYMYKVAISDRNANCFDNVRLRYYDERNKAHLFKVKDIPDCWVRKHFDSDEEWILLKKCRISAREWRPSQ